VRPSALQFAHGLPIDPGKYRVGQTIGAPRDGGRRKHEGLDLMAPRGTEIRVIAPGTVTRVGHIGGYGWVVYVKHPNGFETRYAHMNGRPPVREGQRLNPGQGIGRVGDSGNAAPGACHLHFEIRNASGRPLDPHSMLIF
jgi:murein DD-endopeptidase MepM/ murein hydrolase activator NlpD